tara:strand:- start:4 stop:246 length:243 start_codon:yes stop_codon:yes gene_type:complete
MSRLPAGMHIESGWADEERKKMMKAKLNTSDFNQFCAKVDVLESKGYDMSYTVDRTEDGMYNVEILGEHNIEELDNLTED